MAPIYDPQWIRDQYETYGDREWHRWEENPVEQVKFQVHRRILEDHITSGVRVLDIGAGAGRFTQILAQFTDQIVVADISTKQLELNREHGEREGFASAVEARIECDLRDMSQHFEGNSFDAVVCYGGPLSYLLDQASDGVCELARVAKPGRRSSSA